MYRELPNPIYSKIPAREKSESREIRGSQKQEKKNRNEDVNDGFYVTPGTKKKEKKIFPLFARLILYFFLGFCGVPAVLQQEMRYPKKNRDFFFLLFAFRRCKLGICGGYNKNTRAC